MTDAVPENLKCPHCQKEIGIELTTRLMSNSRMSFTIHPHEGELLSARTVGDSISNMEKLLNAVGKELGAKTAVMIEGLQWTNGSVKIDFLLTRHEAGVKKRPADVAA